MSTLRKAAGIAWVVAVIGCNGVTVDPVTDPADAGQGTGEQCGPQNLEGGPEFEASIPVIPEITAHCERCPCDGDCVGALMQMYEGAVSKGCGEQLRAMFACAAENAIPCKTWSYSPGGTCAAESEALSACLPTCAEGAADAGTTQPQGPCVINCGGNQPWGAECKLEGALFACTCTSGPKQGTAFVLNNCLTGWTTIAEGHCL